MRQKPLHNPGYCQVHCVWQISRQLRGTETESWPQGGSAGPAQLALPPLPPCRPTCHIGTPSQPHLVGTNTDCSLSVQRWNWTTTVLRPWTGSWTGSGRPSPSSSPSSCSACATVPPSHSSRSATRSPQCPYRPHTASNLSPCCPHPTHMGHAVPCHLYVFPSLSSCCVYSVPTVPHSTSHGFACCPMLSITRSPVLSL